MTREEERTFLSQANKVLSTKWDFKSFNFISQPEDVIKQFYTENRDDIAQLSAQQKIVFFNKLLEQKNISEDTVNAIIEDAISGFSDKNFNKSLKLFEKLVRNEKADPNKLAEIHKFLINKERDSNTPKSLKNEMFFTLAKIDTKLTQNPNLSTENARLILKDMDVEKHTRYRIGAFEAKSLLKYGAVVGTYFGAFGVLRMLASPIANLPMMPAIVNNPIGKGPFTHMIETIFLNAPQSPSPFLSQLLAVGVSAPALAADVIMKGAFKATLAVGGMVLPSIPVIAGAGLGLVAISTAADSINHVREHKRLVDNSMHNLAALSSKEDIPPEELSKLIERKDKSIDLAILKNSVHRELVEAVIDRVPRGGIETTGLADLIKANNLSSASIEVLKDRIEHAEGVGDIKYTSLKRYLPKLEKQYKERQEALKNSRVVDATEKDENKKDTADVSKNNVPKEYSFEDVTFEKGVPSQTKDIAHTGKNAEEAFSFKGLRGMEKAAINKDLENSDVDLASMDLNEAGSEKGAMQKEL